MGTSSHLPVLVGAGQTVNHWDASIGAAHAPSAVSLAATAIKRALADAGVDPASVDWFGMVRTNEDSVPSPPPFGRNANPPGTVARAAGITPRHAVYSAIGGQSPQQFVNEASRRIRDGEVEVALIAGGEATGAARAARRAGIELDWTDDADLEFDERQGTDPLLSRNEIKHGLVFPPSLYGIFDNAIAGAEGRNRRQHRMAMSELWARFSAVAANNSLAQFPTERSVEFLSTPSEENFEVSDPYLKWHVAQDAVNLGAAVLVMSEAKADELGVAAGNRVYLHGSGEAVDTLISERAHLDRSWAMGQAIDRALAQVRLEPDQVSLFDLYSCFPSAVFSATRALGLDPFTDPRPLTLTGGLPFFGGPGNNYSLHGIAEMTTRLRGRAGEFGLVLANGGWMTKEAVGIYSTRRPQAFTPTDTPATNAPTMAVHPPADTTTDRGSVHGTLESFTIFRHRDGTRKGTAFIRRDPGSRMIANSTDVSLAVLASDNSPIGAPVTVTGDGERSTFDFG